jgi:hypothetical protein
MSTTISLSSYAYILGLTLSDAIERAEEAGDAITKLADPTEGVRENISAEDARAIAQEDPSLLTVEVDADDVEYVVIPEEQSEAFIEAYQAQVDVLEVDAMWTDDSGAVVRPSIQVRAGRRDEAAGTYYRRSNGTLQILGYSIPVPEALMALTDEAWERALQFPMGST